MSNIQTYLLGALCVSSVMMWWFNTNLPIHIVQILNKLGLKKNNKTFWYSETPIELWTQHDYVNWKMRSLPAWLDELTACTGCFSMHVSFWFALLLVSFNIYNCASFSFFLLAWLGWPYISNVTLALLKKLQKH